MTGLILAFAAGALCAYVSVGVTFVSPLLLRHDRMPTKEEWKAGMRQM